MNYIKKTFQLSGQVKAVLLISSMLGLGIIVMIVQNRPQPLNPEANEIKLEQREDDNQRLMQGMAAVSIEKEIYFDGSTAKGAARIENMPENTMLATVTMILDSDGSTVYRSDIIEPGYYIEEIVLQQSLQKGAHTCTVVWEFYDQESELLIGETAMKTVVIIKE